MIMAKEYLVALFPRSRRVMINGQYMGSTNTKLELEGGSYEVTLGLPNNFAPEKHAIDLSNTSSLMPMIVEFEETGS
jgi:PEGA domain